jgi:hypothetical protein
VSRLNIYNKNKRLNNYARYGFTRFYFWFVNKPTVIALNSVQPELLEDCISSLYTGSGGCVRTVVCNPSASVFRQKKPADPSQGLIPGGQFTGQTPFINAAQDDFESGRRGEAETPQPGRGR